MIQEVIFDASPLGPGERRPLQAWSDKELSVEIRCFTKDPPPPGYKPCSACGVIRTQSAETIYVVADEKVFAKSGGHVEVFVRDASGDERQFRLTVSAQERESSPVAAGY